jgi:hypothetical protein
MYAHQPLYSVASSIQLMHNPWNLMFNSNPSRLRKIISWFSKSQNNWETKHEREFIEAVNKLRNFSVSPSGRLSIDPDEIRDYVIARRQELSHLVDPRHRQKPGIDTAGYEAEACIEVISWRRLSDKVSIRYVCLQALDGSGYSVASARYISDEDPVSSYQDEERRIAQRLMGVTRDLALEWHPTLATALEAHDRAI